ncbi:hypothetical protein GNZ12_14375 [Paraburkholderia sp. 1N]|uniref:Uncharacterized protein n=1 Tax=Paraburkholderia solitsugae TaxID=2675748 RepID=A0ABX2BNY8_9BURK|nr:hypothetical protein [Paraburkholderia solitsugae]NPT42469.1 hypothetical protein [Paraburkholderia solitsugae]
MSLRHGVKAGELHCAAITMTLGPHADGQVASKKSQPCEMAVVCQQDEAVPGQRRLLEVAIGIIGLQRQARHELFRQKYSDRAIW